MDTLFQIKNLYKSFKVADKTVPILKGVSFDVEKEDFLVIFGPSGCGKSTLLHIMIGLENPTSGKVSFLGKDIYKITEDQRAELRKGKIGMLYQQPTWITSLKVLENIAFPLILHGNSFEKASSLALSYLAQTKMENWKGYYPQTLSAGQQQKIGLARAIINNPIILITDEPTGNLDRKSGDELMELLKWQNKTYKRTIIMVTHDLIYLRYAKRIIEVIDGKISEDYKTETEEQKKKILNYIATRKKRLI